jgi:hypothetical protein
MAKGSSLNAEEVARAQHLMRAQKHDRTVGFDKPPPPHPPEFTARLEDARAKASAAAAAASAAAAAAARSACAAAARGSAAAENYVLGPGMQRRGSVGSVGSGAAATARNPLQPPATLEAFLASVGLVQFSAALGVFGIDAVADLAAGSPFDDDDTCRDVGTQILATPSSLRASFFSFFSFSSEAALHSPLCLAGMNPGQISAFRSALRKLAAVPPALRPPAAPPPAAKPAPPPAANPGPSSAPPSEEAFGDAHFGSYAYDDSGLPPSKPKALAAKEAAKAAGRALRAAATGAKPAPPQAASEGPQALRFIAG